MTTCLSRRAHPDKVSFRLYKDGKPKFTIFTEFRCPNIVEGTKVCEECSNKLPMYKYQANQKCDHGLIGGPYPKDSKLYGSPYYLNCIKNGYTILETDEQRAKEAISKATMQVDMTKAKKAIKLSSKPKPKATKSAIPVIETTGVTTVTQESSVVTPTILESTELPIVVSDISIVKVRKIHHKNKDYYFDEDSGKLYEANNGVGKCAGYYNTETSTLDPRAESDSEFNDD